MPTVLTTGAGRGIGLEIVRQYAAEGWDVIACARNPDKSAELAKISGRVSIHALDVTNFAAIDALARSLSDRSIDVLINTAGVMGRTTAFGASNYAEWDEVFHLNVFAPTKMSEAFAPHVTRGEQKKIVALSTQLASIAQNELGAFYAYRGSKAALNAIMHSMAIDLGRKHGISIALIHPGWVKTDMGGSRAPLEVSASVSGIRQVVAKLDKENSGKFWDYAGKELPW
jgi:NAD(P)-dependent dehydrogenase (short-subunit alcohol dehydrogenase family)